MKKWDEDIHSSSMSSVSGLYAHCKHKRENYVRDFSDPFALANLLAELDDSQYGSVTNEIEELSAQWKQIVAVSPALSTFCTIPTSTLGGVTCYGTSSGFDKSIPMLMNKQKGIFISENIIDLDVDCASNDTMNKEIDSSAIVIIDSDEEDGQNLFERNKVLMSETGEHNAEVCVGHQTTKVVLSDDNFLTRQGQLSCKLPGYNNLFGGDICTAKEKIRNFSFHALDNPTLSEQVLLQLGSYPRSSKQHQLDVLKENIIDQNSMEISMGDDRGNKGVILEVEVPKDETEVVESMAKSYGFFPTESLSMECSSHGDEENDDLKDIWEEMTVALGCTKIVAVDGPAIVKKGEECSHEFDLEDDLGLVCKQCGVILKGIESIIEYQWKKASRSTRTSMNDSRGLTSIIDKIKSTALYGLQESEDDPIIDEISIHPRHKNVMMAHQLEGFNFLRKNLLTDNPGGCILAHAPGSGKTFMIISFIQSFLASFPHARPLIILPKGIIPTWLKEFKLWQIEEIPLHDMYSSKAESRESQLKVLKSWQENKSILFLGYKQFSSIVCEGTPSAETAACQDLLLKVPGLLILDEGHTPRNEDTDVLHSLGKVQTPRKVVLSGTLYQNHVREVFNILNLVRPRFLKLERSRPIVRRILNRSGSRRNSKSRFSELVEETLQSNDHQRKSTVIQDLRELMHEVLHYYKGELLEELPGLVDFTVILNLTGNQKSAVQRLGDVEGQFKKSSVGTAIYMHPSLEKIASATGGSEGSGAGKKIEKIIMEVDPNDGVKTKFFLSILSLSVSFGEKLLVFSQYRIPLIFLEKLTISRMGWRLRKEIFEISGKSTLDERERSMEQFNSSPDAKVLFGSIKACGEGVSLVGATRVLLLDVHLNPSVTRQAIGRAFRPGQTKKVYTYRLVAADSPEEKDHVTSFNKELISKMWFEWTEFCGHQAFQMDEVSVDDCGDLLLENSSLGVDIKSLLKR